MASLCQLDQRLYTVAEMCVVIGQLGGGADHRDLDATLQHLLADSRVEHRGLGAGVAAHEDDEIGVMHSHDLGVHQILRADVCAELGRVRTHFQLLAANAVHEIAERGARLHVRERADDPSDAVDLGADQLGFKQRERLLPGQLFISTVTLP